MTTEDEQDESAELSKIAARLSKRPAPNYSDQVRKIAGKLKPTPEDGKKGAMRE